MPNTYIVDIIVDLQNDFVDGALGTAEAQGIVGRAAATAAQAAPETALFEQLSRTLGDRERFYRQARLRHTGAATVAVLALALAKAGFRPT